MKQPRDCTSVGEVREEIDAIDREILRLLGLRFAFAKETVRFKNNAREVVAQKRYDEVIARRREMATANGLDPNVIEKVYRTLMDHLIQEEMKLLEQKAKAANKE